MKRQSEDLVRRWSERAEDLSRRWREFSCLSVAVVVACSLLGGLVGAWVAPTASLVPVDAVIGVMAGGCGGFVAWVLLALRLGLFPSMSDD